MALGWLTILKTVPWSDVISNAPMVADGAKKLWKAVAKKTASSEPDITSFTQTPLSRESDIIAEMESRLAILEVAAAELQAQILATSELLKDIANQNALLIQRIENNRRWILILTAATTVLMAAIAALLWP